MLMEEVLLEKIKALPANRQQEMLDFAEFLAQKAARPRRSLYGALADLEFNLTEEDITEARREVWDNFPREHFFDQKKDK